MTAVARLGAAVDVGSNSIHLLIAAVGRARLRTLGTREPDAEAWREVEAALADKWWGVRTVAIATLCVMTRRATNRASDWFIVCIPSLSCPVCIDE